MLDLGFGSVTRRGADRDRFRVKRAPSITIQKVFEGRRYALPVLRLHLAQPTKRDQLGDCLLGFEKQSRPMLHLAQYRRSPFRAVLLAARP